MNVLELWLPILLSAVAVFAASSIVHMVLPFHRGDQTRLPAEDRLLEAIREAGVGPGSYMFPCPSSMKDMAAPEMQARYARGPVGFMTVAPNGPPRIGRSLIGWFAWCVVAGLFVAWVALAGLPRAAGFAEVFRMTGTVAILAYAPGNLTNSLWKADSWRTTARFALDGVAYGLITAAIFAGLW